MKYKTGFKIYSGQCFVHILERDIQKILAVPDNGWMNMKEAISAAIEYKLEMMPFKKISKFLQRNNSGKPVINIDWFERAEKKKVKTKGG